MSVMEGDTTVGQVQGTGGVQEELAFADAGGRDTGDEQMDATPKGTTEPASKDNPSTAETGKNSNSLKARKRTKTGCLSKSHVQHLGSPSRLISNSMPQAKDKVWGRTANVQQLCQVQAQLRGLYTPGQIQTTQRSLSSSRRNPSPPSVAFFDLDGPRRTSYPVSASAN